jgi:hypothetical protein
LALVALLGLSAASCAGEDQRGTASHRMAEWVGGTGFGDDIGTLVADNARVPKDIPNGTGAVHAACGALEDDAEMANGELPTPDQKVTDLLSTAYGLEGTAGTDCYNAGVTNKKLMSVAIKDTIKAEALYDQALARIRSIDGAPVSTTTTTDNGGGSIFG